MVGALVHFVRGSLAAFKLEIGNLQQYREIKCKFGQLRQDGLVESFLDAAYPLSSYYCFFSLC